MEPHDANSIAVAGHAKAVRDALKRLGMRRCSLRLVYYQCEPPDECRTNWYASFRRWMRALWLAHPAGFELLWDDLQVFVAGLREAQAAHTAACWREQFIRCESEHSDVIKAAVMNDLRHMRREAVESIAANRKLVAAIDAELSGTATRAA